MKNPPLADARTPLARVALIFTGFVAVFGVVYAFTVLTVTGRELADASLRGAISAPPLFIGTVDTILDVVSVASLLGAVAVVALIALVRLARLEGLVAIGASSGPTSPRGCSRISRSSGRISTSTRSRPRP